MNSARLSLGHLSGKLRFRDTLREPDLLSNTVGKEMTYRISYDDGLAAMSGARDHEGVTRTEYFLGENDALQRERQLLETAITTASRCATAPVASWREFACN
jgi:hypothetical protein